MLRKEHKRPEYLEINPKAKVPMLVIDGVALTESVAIHIWTARRFPQATLLPADPWKELNAISLLAWFSSGIHPFLTRINPNVQVSDVPGTDEGVRRWAKGLLLENYAIAEDMLAGRDFFFDHFTAVDAHFFWCFRRGTQLVGDLSKFSNCTAHFESMKRRPSVQKLEALERSVLEEFARAA